MLSSEIEQPAVKRCLFKMFKYFSFAYDREHVSMWKRNWSPYIYAQAVLCIPFGWLGFVKVHLSGSREHLRGTEVVVILGLSSPLWLLSNSGQHEWTEHCGCPGERELHLNFWEHYPNFTPYKLQLLALPTYQYSFWSFHFHLDKFSCLSICFNFFMSVSTPGERKRLLWGRTSVRKEPSPLFSKGLALEPHSHPLCDYVGGS